jgi:hypothetical protein
VSGHTDGSVVVIEPSMDEDRRWRVKELADDTAICGCRVLRTINTVIKTAQDCCQGVPHHLTCDSGRATRFVNLERFRRGNVLDQISAIDETWARAFYPKFKRQSSDWRHTEITQGLTECYP